MTTNLATRAAIAALAFCVLPAAAQDAASPAPPVSLQLNKLEPVDGRCRAYFIVGNRLDEPLRTLQVDTFIFDPDGVISSRAALAFEGVRAGREKVALFDFALACDAIDRFLINEVLACDAASGPLPACNDGLAASSKAAAALDY